MKEYLKSWIPKIKKFSLELDKLSKLYNQPWVVINEDSEFLKLIFQKNGNLIVSKNGVVSYGGWELIPYSNSILLEIDGKKRLYNHQFIDYGIMILKLDGSVQDLFVLVNHNVIPDLDIDGYLESKYSHRISQNKNTKVKSIYDKEIKLDDGQIFQVINDSGYNNKSEVKINHDSPNDGLYRTANLGVAYEVENGLIVMEYYIKAYRQKNGDFIEVGGNRISGIAKGSPVWLNGYFAPDGTYKLSWFSKFQVKDGRIHSM